MGERYRILVIGNNAAKSSQLFDKLELSYPGNNCIETEQARLEFYAYPDLNLFNRFQEPQIDASIRQLIGDTTDGGGVSLFLILISQTEIFSNAMKEMLMEIPQSTNFKSERYFWDHAAILFSFEDNATNYQQEMSNSINRNSGIRKVVNRAGERYSWMSNSDSREEILGRIQNENTRIYSTKGLANSIWKILSSRYFVIITVMLIIIITVMLIILFSPIIIPFTIFGTIAVVCLGGIICCVCICVLPVKYIKQT